MYYDRRVPPDLLALLAPDAPLGWLLPWLHTGTAAGAGAHVQTRRDRGSRTRGGLQLYLGRTSPLEVRRRAGPWFRLHADPFYVALTPRLFAADLDAGQLAREADALRAHVELAARSTHRSFLDGEAVVHAGLMRRHGPLATEDAPFLALDAEARIGFASMAEQRAFEASLPDRVGLPATEDMPRKLDVVAVDGERRLLLVEVKADATGLTRAAWQAAVHVARFKALLGDQPTWFSHVLGGLAEDKARVGLLGRARLPSFAGAPAVTPVLAAPDPRDGWDEAWRREIAPVVRASRGTLDGLRLWRLAPDGARLADVPA